MSRFLLSPKYKDFLRYRGASVEFLEGTTAAGKTTVGAVKFLLMVAADRCGKSSVIAGLDNGTVEKNIINADFGLIDVFGDQLEYNGNGTSRIKLPHLLLHTSTGDRVIYVLGYDDSKRWKKALGGQLYGLYIDELNIANMDFVREASMRCDYLMGTLNPDSPELPIYREYVNHARPLPQYATDGPKELRSMLDEPEKPGWVWWYFSFDHNAALSDEKRRKIVDAVPPGTKIYKNKILGLRGKATGLVFSNFDRRRHCISAEAAAKDRFIQFSLGVDTSYSSKSDDTIAFAFIGITADHRCILLAEKVYNNRDLNTPVAPSDTAKNLVDFADRCRERWGAFRDIFIDSADAATITECGKYKRQSGCLYNFYPAWKKTKIFDRILLQSGWYAHDQFLVVGDCAVFCGEMDRYSWQDDKDATPEDGNDHMINATQYAWLPYKEKIGGETP